MPASPLTTKTLHRTDSLAPAIFGAAMMIAWGITLPLWMPKNGDAQVIASAAARLAHLPAILGDWDSTATSSEESHVEAAGAAGILTRHYRHRNSGAAVTVVLLCGTPRIISVHPPTACYRGMGFEPESTPVIVSLVEPESNRDGADAGTARPTKIALFQSAVFRRPSSSSLVEDERIQLLWSWTDDGRWNVPAVPRLTFARAPVLYKLYIARNAIDGNAAESNSTDDELRSFAALLVEGLRSSVVESVLRTSEAGH